MAAVVSAAVLGVGVGWAAARFGSLLHLELTPAHGAAVVAAVLAAAAMVRWPAAGLLVLVLTIYLHLSDVLIRFHGFPSVLQLLVPALALAVLVEWRADLLEAAAPRSIVVALAAYVVVVVVSSVVAVDGPAADAAIAESAKGFVLFLLVAALAATPERVRAGAWTLWIGGVLLAGLTLFQVLAGDFGATFGGLARVDYGQVYGDVVEPRASGPLGDPNFFAQILVVVVPIALLLAWKERRAWLRVVALAGAGVIAAGTIVTYSRGGALALGAVVVLGLFAGRPGRGRLAAGVALLAFGFVLLPPDFTRRLDTLRHFLPGQERVVEVDSSIRNRKLLMRAAWRMFEDRPVLGVGAGNYPVRFAENADEIGSTVHEYEDIGRPHYPHNLYLQIASETGFAGLITFGAALILVLAHLRRAGRAYFGAGRELYGGLAVGLQIAIVGYLITALFLHAHFPRYLWLLLGLSAALAREAPPGSAAAAGGGASR